MTSLTLFPPYPIYFFDQPAPPRSKKGKVATAGKEKRAENGKQLKLLKKVKSDCLAETSANEETCEDESTDDESEDPLASQKRAAPRLLNELGRLLHRHRGASLQVGHLLNYSAEAALKPPPAKDAAPRRAARRKKSPKKSFKADQDATDDDAAAADEASAVSPTPTDEMISGGGQDPDWLALPLQALGEDTPPPRGLCQWVVERLQASNSLHIKRRVLDQVPSSPILRHYVDAKAGMKSRSVLSAASEAAEPTPRRTPSLKKLHCRSTDGTSFIYYPSGNMAVCHSPSALPAGGFCTNVFADSHASAVLATVTAFGHGSASHPVSLALWDRHGGFMCDWEGNLKKEWCWKTDREQDKIVVKLAKGISLRLLSGTSAVLCFKCEDNKVQLPLSALPYSAKEAEAEQMFPEASAGTLSARWTKGCHGTGELTKMRKKVRDILDAWLDLYCSATGMKRSEKKPKTPRGKHKRRAHASAPPAKKSPERVHGKPAKTKENAAAAKLESPGKKAPREAPPKTRVPAKNTKEHSMVQIGPLRILGNIKQELVILPDHPDLRLAALPRLPVRCRLAPSVPLTVCPLLLRAALLKQLTGPAPRRCRCSTALMPVLLDAEYDAFVTGQPRHSQQILVVVVTLPVKPGSAPEQDAVQQLYRKCNRSRTMPCAQVSRTAPHHALEALPPALNWGPGRAVQCQMDSFRLLRYEVSTGALGCPVDNILLQHRHNVAAGMILMYIRGRLMFLGYVSGGRSTFSVLDLQKQILRTREDYRMGVSLPPDYKFSKSVKVSMSAPEASNANKVDESALALANNMAAAVAATHSPDKDYVADT
ncbi:uncharacterized protein C3orf20-like isoform X1 [Syngnathus acus]|uniref:uncharacterized protein C3orf20-like isoform X1 n=1 Tax=Syngnathus acus TaxID=161584 RepID=UPI001885C351|nr:uncharacterized protein C3orf20-like isoform X1 [Syngnathus acus]XP_037109741.1 uncharacterized protein C3orf20-like isoform X1 [Syngnathus acus]